MKKLKTFKKLLALAASALLLAVLPDTGALTVSAAEPVTYYIMYDDTLSNGGDWVYQTGSSWDDSAEHREIYYMNEQLKDGDIVIVGNASPSLLTLNVHLSNLTIKKTGDTFAMISVTGGIDNCYFLSGTQGSVTGNVTNGYVYNNSTANFNNNVTNLYSFNDDSETGPTIGVVGTVGYYEAQDSSKNFPPHGADFDAGSFYVENGNLKTPYERYTPDAAGPSASSTQTAATPAPAAPTPAATPAASGSSADEYDKVPKTGETSPALWLSLTAASCLCAGLALKKSSNR